MHAPHWNLQKPPFAMGNAEPVFYAGIPQQEALARLRFLVHNQRRLGLLLGEPVGVSRCSRHCLPRRPPTKGGTWHGSI